jgi:hypothetical protein
MCVHVLRKMGYLNVFFLFDSDNEGNHTPDGEQVLTFVIRG